MKDQFKFDENQAELAHHALERLEQKLIHTLDAHRLGILLFDCNGDLLACNRQWERLFHLQYSEVADYNVLEDTNLHKKHIWQPIKHAFEGTGGVIEENWFSPEEWGKRGRDRWTEGNVLPVHAENDNDRQLGAAIFLQDITDKKQTAAEIEQLRTFLTDVRNQQEDICRRLSDLLDMAQQKNRRSLVHGHGLAMERHPFIPRREREVFEKLAAGHTVKEAAHQLGLGVKSVYTYRARLLKRLGLSGDVGLALAWREIYAESSEAQSSTETNTENPS